MKNVKLVFITIVLLTLVAIDVSMADWKKYTNTKLKSHNTIRFISPLEWSDNEYTINVGECLCEYTNPDLISGGYESLEVSITNAYPEYEAYSTFTLKNVGESTDTIEAILVSDPTGKLEWIWTTEYTNGFLWKDNNSNLLFDPSEEVIEITITELIGISLPSSESMTAQIDIHIADNAEENQSYGLEVIIAYEEGN